jgi:membrane dipeptidase
MASQPVFDYVATQAPWFVSDRMEDVMHTKLDAGKHVTEAWDALNEEEINQIRDDPGFRSDLREFYRSTGVNLISPTMASREPGLDHVEGTWHALARWQARVDHLDWMHKVTSPDVARDVVDNDDVGVVINTQNLGLAINGNVDRVNKLFNQGMRIYQLTYNYQNLVGTGCSDPSEGGLSKHGREVVSRLNDLNAIVDLSHCGYQTTLDTIEHSDAPVAFTHTACREVHDHFRGKWDDELEALADVDGYMGIVGLPWFLDAPEARPTLDQFFKHMDYAIDILGVDRIGIGTDYFPADSNFPDRLLEGHKQMAIDRGFPRENVEKRSMGVGFGEFKTWGDWPVLRAELEDRYTEDEVRGILGENFLDFWDRVLEA